VILSQTLFCSAMTSAYFFFFLPNMILEIFITVTCNFLNRIYPSNYVSNYYNQSTCCTIPLTVYTFIFFFKKVYTFIDSIIFKNKVYTFFFLRKSIRLLLYCLIYDYCTLFSQLFLL
jgi:hypothetical protein